MQAEQVTKKINRTVVTCRIPNNAACYCSTVAGFSDVSVPRQPQQQETRGPTYRNQKYTLVSEVVKNKRQHGLKKPNLLQALEGIQTLQVLFEISKVLRYSKAKKLKNWRRGRYNGPFGLYLRNSVTIIRTKSRPRCRVFVELILDQTETGCSR